MAEGHTMKGIAKFHALKEAFDASPLSVGVELRFDLADIIINALKTQGITQRELAKRTGMQEAYISRVIHGNANCQFDVAGKILFALGLSAELVAHHGVDQVRVNNFVFNWSPATGKQLLGHLLEGETAHGYIEKVIKVDTSGAFCIGAFEGQTADSGPRQSAARP